MPSLDFKRSDRVSDLIHSEVAKIFSTEVRDPRLAGITIIKVEMTTDMKHDNPQKHPTTPNQPIHAE